MSISPEMKFVEQKCIFPERRPPQATEPVMIGPQMLKSVGRESVGRECVGPPRPPRPPKDLHNSLDPLRKFKLTWVVHEYDRLEKTRISNENMILSNYLSPWMMPIYEKCI